MKWVFSEKGKGEKNSEKSKEGGRGVKTKWNSEPGFLLKGKGMIKVERTLSTWKNWLYFTSGLRSSQLSPPSPLHKTRNDNFLRMVSTSRSQDLSCSGPLGSLPPGILWRSAECPDLGSNVFPGHRLHGYTQTWTRTPPGELKSFTRGCQSHRINLAIFPALTELHGKNSKYWSFQHGHIQQDAKCVWIFRLKSKTSDK